MQYLRVTGVLALILFFQTTVGAQIISIQKVGDKTVTCMHSGLFSDLNDCGVPEWYAYVFVGVIAAITPAKDDEKEIQIVPEEVFGGTPKTPLTVLTSQGSCLPELKLGDRWLFYLRKEAGKPIILDYYGNDSLPVAHALERIETLRRLRTIGDFAIVRGRVMRDVSYSGETVSHAKVTARRLSDGLQFVSTTGSDGRYELPPLPPGEYKITVDRIGSYQPDDSSITVRSGQCWSLTLSRSPHALIGGHVRRYDGSPVPDVDVVLISSDNTSYTTTHTDRDGYFKFDGQRPGEFVVGLNFPNRPDWFNGGGAGAGVKIPPASMFYPGVVDRAHARIIHLATDEKLDKIDFTLPSQ